MIHTNSSEPEEIQMLFIQVLAKKYPNCASLIFTTTEYPHKPIEYSITGKDRQKHIIFDIVVDFELDGLSQILVKSGLLTFYSGASATSDVSRHNETTYNIGAEIWQSLQ